MMLPSRLWLRPPSLARSLSTLRVTTEGGLRTITLNRPEKFNAFNIDMYTELREELDLAAKDPSAVVTVITGAGKYFSSGNDLTSFSSVSSSPGGRAAAASASAERLVRFVDAFIDFPKPLVGVVNGPAIGIGCTMLGLMDVVFASDSATFHVPFTALALTPEACSSYTFPRTLGASLANEMLLFNRKLTAGEARAAGLVSQVWPAASLLQDVSAMQLQLAHFAKLPSSALQYSKDLVREAERPLLREINRRESKRLEERWTSDEVFLQAEKFMKSRKKSV